MEEFEPKHHVIILKEADTSLFFTVDFELVEIQYPKKLIELKGFWNLDFWNAIMEIACKSMGKESRRVFADRRGTNARFGETIWEYVAESDNGQWLYFVESKTYYWPRFANSPEIERAASDYRCGIRFSENREVKNEVFWHYCRVLEHVRKQGLTKIQHPREADSRAFDNLMSLLTQKIDGNSTGTTKAPRCNHAQT